MIEALGAASAKVQTPNIRMVVRIIENIRLNFMFTSYRVEIESVHFPGCNLIVFAF